MPAIVHVEPITPARALRGPFDYRVPRGWPDVPVGGMLVVPFGPRQVLGVVVGRAEHSELAPERLAEPLRALDPALPADLVDLAGWMAAAYCSTPARALALVLPPGAGAGPRPRVRPRLALVAELTAAGRAALGAGADGDGDGADGAACRLTAGQRTVLGRLAEHGALPATALDADHGRLRRLQARGLVALERRVRARRPPGPAAERNGRAGREPPLTAEQRDALAPVLAALGGAAAAPARGSGSGGAASTAAAGAGRFLLHGVTGSGKTEVYLRAVGVALAHGRGAIVLVSEIALTPQTVARFQQRFGDTVAVLHSRLGAGERYDEWLRLARGEARVCIGPRSAVFAPVADLGLVVVDEEHDASYKHEGDPRYDARGVADRRAERSGAVLLAGSATPRPESAHALRRLRLDARVDHRPLPPVEVLDMRGARHPLHPETRAALADVRRAGGKAVVLLNRRGWSNFLSCRSCGRVWTCPSCDVALVLHRGGAVGEGVACHHCGHVEPAPRGCPACGSVSVARHGAGTERLERDLADALGDTGFPVLRLDADVAATRGALEATLARFAAAPGGALVGTQTIAKGHDFPDVTLGVVLDADQTLRFPDFRAEERTFALVAQLAGRVGRGPGGGRVVVQTLAPDAPAIRRAAEHDSDGFLAGELARRRALRYPPFGHLVRIVCSAPAAAHAAGAAAAVADGLAGVRDAAVLGPAPLFRLRGRERRQVVVKGGDRDAAIAAVAATVAEVAERPVGRRASLSVDVDPQ